MPLYQDTATTVTDATITTSDITTNDASTAKHGWMKKLSNVSTEYLSGTGVWGTPSGTGAVATDPIWDAAGDLAVGSGANTAAKLTLSATAGQAPVSTGAALAYDYPEVGLVAYAYPLGFDPMATISSSAAMPANGGSRAAQILLPSPMALDSISVRNLDASLTRTLRWDLYYQDNLASATATRVAASSADDSFVAAAASTRTIAAGSAPVRLRAGTYWIVVQNTHATNTWAVGIIAAGTIARNVAMSKTTTNPNGATLDLSTGWGHATSGLCVVLQGRVFNEGALF